MDGEDEALAIGYLVADPKNKAVYQKKLATMSRTNAFQQIQGNNDIKEVAADALRRENVREGIAPIVGKREKVLEKRGIMEALSGTPLPPDVNDKIGTMVTGIHRKPKPGGRRFTRKQCKTFKCAKMGFTQKASCRPYKNCYRRSTTGGVHQKRRTHKRHGRYEGPYINPTYNTLPFKW